MVNTTERMALDLEKFADKIESGKKLVTPDEMNCASLMRVAAKSLLDKDTEGNLFGSIGGLIDEARSRGMNWTKVHGVLSSLTEVAKIGIASDLREVMFHKEKK